MLNYSPKIRYSQTRWTKRKRAKICSYDCALAYPIFCNSNFHRQSPETNIVSSVNHHLLQRNTHTRCGGNSANEKRSTAEVWTHTHTMWWKSAQWKLKQCCHLNHTNAMAIAQTHSPHSSRTGQIPHWNQTDRCCLVHHHFGDVTGKTYFIR